MSRPWRVVAFSNPLGGTAGQKVQWSAAPSRNFPTVQEEPECRVQLFALVVAMLPNCQLCLSFFALETESTLALESDMLCWTLISSKDLL